MGNLRNKCLYWNPENVTSDLNDTDLLYSALGENGTLNDTGFDWSAYIQEESKNAILYFYFF